MPQARAGHRPPGVLLSGRRPLSARRQVLQLAAWVSARLVEGWWTPAAKQRPQLGRAPASNCSRVKPGARRSPVIVKLHQLLPNRHRAQAEPCA